MGRMKEIAEHLKSAQSVLIFAHTNMDGDALGSSAALCHTLRSMGKTSYIMVEDKTADNLVFMDKGYCTEDLDIVTEPDVCICLDCHGEDRMPKRYGRFMSGKTLLCIDHHATNAPFEGIAVVDSAAAATGELIYELFEEMKITPDKEAAEALYAAITTDTGNFQYSNCTKKTHEIAAALYEAGIDHNKVSVEIYESIAPGKIKLESAILNEVRFVADGKAAIAYVTQEMLDKTGTLMEDTEGVVAKLRSIRGVEVSALLKEKEDGIVKVSMRAKTYGNVAAICEAYGGGGHIKAAGCTLEMSMEEALAEITKAIEANL